MEEEEIVEEPAVVPPKPVVPAAPAPAPKPTPIEVRPAPSVKAPAVAPPAGVIPPPPVGGAPIMRPSSPNMELVDMEEDSSDEETEEIAVDKRPMPPPVAAPPPINPEKVVIKHNYDPKATAPSMVPGGAPGTDEQMLISPLTGERVPASKMAEHMRIGLLDPKWVEQKDRALAEKMQRTEVFAPGASIENSLRNMASRRTDIFGAGDEETDIGKKIGEEEDEGTAPGPSDSSKVVWDGHSSSMEQTARKARENITVADQIKHLQLMKGIINPGDKIGPTPTSGPPSSSAIPPPPISRPVPPPISRPAPPPGVPNVPASVAGVPPPGLQRPQPPPPFNMPRPPMVPVPPPRPPMMGMPPRPPMGMPPRPPMGMPPRPPMMAPPSMPPRMSPADEPPNKKAKSEDNLMPESLWLAQHNSGPITVKVVIPQDSSKPEWNLNGQTLSFNLPLTESVAVLKNKIMEAISIPIAKQKLQVDGIFTKDPNTLAFYNVNNGAQFLLSSKERD